MKLQNKRNAEIGRFGAGVWYRVNDEGNFSLLCNGIKFNKDILNEVKLIQKDQLERGIEVFHPAKIVELLVKGCYENYYFGIYEEVIDKFFDEFSASQLVSRFYKLPKLLKQFGLDGDSYYREQIFYRIRKETGQNLYDRFVESSVCFFCHKASDFIESDSAGEFGLCEWHSL